MGAVASATRPAVKCARSAVVASRSAAPTRPSRNLAAAVCHWWIAQKNGFSLQVGSPNHVRDVAHRRHPGGGRTECRPTRSPRRRHGRVAFRRGMLRTGRRAAPASAFARELPSPIGSMAESVTSVTPTRRGSSATQSRVRTWYPPTSDVVGFPVMTTLSRQDVTRCTCAVWSTLALAESHTPSLDSAGAETEHSGSSLFRTEHWDCGEVGHGENSKGVRQS